MTTTSSVQQRRTLNFSTLAEFQADAERWSRSELKTVGNWTFGQILEHLARVMNCSIDGFGVKASWYRRVFVAPLIRNSLLTEQMKPGVKLPKRASVLIAGPETSTETGLRNVRNAIARLQGEQPMAAHPLLGKMTTEEWLSLHLRHAELHMSFVVPVDQ